MTDEAAPSKGTEPQEHETCCTCRFPPGIFAQANPVPPHECPYHAALRARLEAAEAEKDELRQERNDMMDNLVRVLEDLGGLTALRPRAHNPTAAVPAVARAKSAGRRGRPNRS